MSGSQLVDFWFDPSCPYTWITSRWVVEEVAEARPLEVRWHVMSLAVLNEHRSDNPEGDPERLWPPVRVAAAVQSHHGSQALGRFYTALWSQGRSPAFVSGAQEQRPVLRESLGAAELPEELAEAVESTSYDAEVRASHEEGVSLVGPHIGTPILAVSDGQDRTAFFGPVTSRVPRGQEALRLWDGTLQVAGVRGFHVLKGPPYEAPEL